MIKEKIPELQKLSTADKFALAGDELSSKSDEIPVTEDQLNELDRRFEEYRQDADKVVTWEQQRLPQEPPALHAGGDGEKTGRSSIRSSVSQQRDSRWLFQEPNGP